MLEIWFYFENKQIIMEIRNPKECSSSYLYLQYQPQSVEEIKLACNLLRQRTISEKREHIKEAINSIAHNQHIIDSLEAS